MKIPMNDLDKIKASENLKRKTLLSVMKKKRGKFPYVKLVSATAIVCLLFLLFYNLMLEKEDGNPILVAEVYSYVSIDINPSMELQLDVNDNVIAVVSYNEEAKQILQSIDVNGLKAQEALNNIVNNKDVEQYIKDGFMQISVYSKDEEHSRSLEKMINETLSNSLDETQYGCMYSSESIYDQAHSLHMSFGKYQVITMILEVDRSYDMEELQNLSMMALKNLYENISGENLYEAHGNHQCEKNGHH